MSHFSQKNVPRHSHTNTSLKKAQKAEATCESYDIGLRHRHKSGLTFERSLCLDINTVLLPAKGTGHKRSTTPTATGLNEVLFMGYKTNGAGYNLVYRAKQLSRTQCTVMQNTHS